jgi:4-amino-4-deoxy-L-arabinose transferase-like glycosyltransferase
MVKKIILIALICLGIFLRVYQFNSLPAGLFMDEVTMAVDTKTLVQNGTDQYGNRFPFTFEDVTDFKLPVYVYLSAIMYKIFGPHVFTIRLVALLASVGSIFSLGYLTKLLFEKKKYLPLIAMGVISLSPFAIHFARIAYETTLATFLLSLFLISLIKVFRGEKKLFWFIIGSLMAVLSTYTYPGPRFTVPVFTFLLFLISLFIGFEKQEKKQIIISLIGFLTVIILSFIPTLILSPVATSRSLNYLGMGVAGHGIAGVISKISFVVSSWIRTWDLEFLFDKGDLFAYRASTKEIGIFLSVFIVPYIVGLFYFFKNFRLRNFPLLFLGLFALVAGLPSALTAAVPYSTRITPLLFPLCIIIALGIEQLGIFLSKRNKKIQIIIAFVFGVILIYQIALFSYIYFVHFKSTSQPEFPQASIEVSQYLKGEMTKNPDKPIYFLNDTTCGPWTFDALFLWYFADLPNQQMIKWNNTYRTARYNAKGMSPFDAFWKITIPTGKIENITLFPGYKKSEGSGMFVRCGFHLQNINTKKEKIDRIFYLHEDIKTDPFYVVSETR